MPIAVTTRRSQRGRDSHGQILDVTSRGSKPWQRFSPFYPHGGIPVPFSPDVRAQSVEGIWQGLKVFELADIDLSKFSITSMKGLKRSSRRFGRVLGHRAGVGSDRLLPYVAARQQIYLPAYRWVLEHCVQDLVEDLRTLGRSSSITLLDYTSNGDVEDASRPLSHAALIVRYIEGTWPMPQNEQSESQRLVR